MTYKICLDEGHKWIKHDGILHHCAECGDKPEQLCDRYCGNYIKIK